MSHWPSVTGLKSLCLRKFQGGVSAHRKAQEITTSYCLEMLSTLPDDPVWLRVSLDQRSLSHWWQCIVLHCPHPPCWSCIFFENLALGLTRSSVSHSSSLLTKSSEAAILWLSSVSFSSCAHFTSMFIGMCSRAHFVCIPYPYISSSPRPNLHIFLDIHPYLCMYTCVFAHVLCSHCLPLLWPCFLEVLSVFFTPMNNGYCVLEVQPSITVTFLLSYIWNGASG